MKADWLEVVEPGRRGPELRQPSRRRQWLGLLLPDGRCDILREQFLLYVLGEKLQLEVGQGDFSWVLPLFKVLFWHLLVICFRRSKRMCCWL